MTNAQFLTVPSILSAVASAKAEALAKDSFLVNSPLREAFL
jgi:hypothetical protein